MGLSDLELELASETIGEYLRCNSGLLEEGTTLAVLIIGLATDWAELTRSLLPTAVLG